MARGAPKEIKHFWLSSSGDELFDKKITLLALLFGINVPSFRSYCLVLPSDWI